MEKGTDFSKTDYVKNFKIPVSFTLKHGTEYVTFTTSIVACKQSPLKQRKLL